MEYEIEKIDDIGASLQFKVNWTVKIDGKKKSGTGDWAFSKSTVYKIISYDKDNNPIPRWKYIIERALKEIEEIGNAPSELKPVVGKKIKI